MQLRIAALAGALLLTACASQAKASPGPTPDSRAGTSEVALPEHGPVTVSELPAEPRSPVRLVGFRARVGNLDRTWTIALPPGDSRVTGLVVVLHGVGGTGLGMRSLGFESFTATDGVAIAYPDAVEGSWNDERDHVDARSHREHVDDVGFIQVLVNDARQRLAIDPRRVYVAGFSNGGIFASYIACRAPGVAHAYALVAASAASNVGATCERSTVAAPILMIQGTVDQVVPYRGGRVATFAGRARGAVLGFDNSFAWFRLRAKCADTSEAALATVPPIHRFEGTNCSAGPGPIAFSVDGAGHDWVTRPGFGATDVVWTFFRETTPR